MKTFLGEMYVLGIIRDKFVAIECFSESHKFDTRCSSTLIITLKECKKLINQSVCCFQGCYQKKNYKLLRVKCKLCL